ncbi:MAG: hypothetical protein ACT4P1_10695 [Sporichthyaceae bacterium]
MSLIALFSDKGSPGTTTLGLTLAAVWPRPVALVECDPAGGDLAVRLTDPAGRPVLRPELGLLTLAAAARREPATAGTAVREHGQMIPGTRSPGPVVLPGVSSPEQGAGLAGLWPMLAASLAGAEDGDVLADLGRLHPGSPALAVAEAADVLVGVARGTAEGMLRLRDRFAHLLSVLPTDQYHPRRAFVVLVVEDRRAGEAVTAMRSVLEHAALPVGIAGFLAMDLTAVQSLLGGQGGARLDRSLLARSARTLAIQLQPTTGSQAPSTPAPPREPRRRLTTIARSR